MNLSIKNVPEEVVDRLKQRAKTHHRSLQGELLSLLEAGAGPRKLTVWELYQRVQDLDFSTPSESTQIIREDRDSR